MLWLPFSKISTAPSPATRLHQTLAIFSLLATLVITGQSTCASVSSIKNYSLIGHVYKTTFGKSLITCIVTCDEDPECYSLNYMFPTSTCELSNATRTLYLKEFVYSPDALYLDHLFRPAGSCSGEWPCKNEGTCFNVPRAPGYECECKHDYIGDTCEVCSSPPLGIQNGRITDRQLTASSEGMWLNLQTFRPADCRLMRSSASWVSSVLDNGPWLQVKFSPKIKLISGIATQGNPSHDWWTTSYTVAHSMTGKTWQDYEKDGQLEVFSANTDRNTVVKHKIFPNIKAAFIRVIPLTKYMRTALRMELYGCDYIAD